MLSARQARRERAVPDPYGCPLQRPSIMGRYVEEEIGKIPPEDIEAASRGGHPTVLVVGPGYFVRPIYERLQSGRYPQAELRRSEELAVEPIHGYRRLLRDQR